jgi:hypothetical protein
MTTPEMHMHATITVLGGLILEFARSIESLLALVDAQAVAGYHLSLFAWNAWPPNHVLLIGCVDRYTGVCGLSRITPAMGY